MDVLREVVLPKFEGVQKRGGYWMARCPGHEDHEASLSITAGKEHPVVFDCKAGCDPRDILAKLGLTWDTLCKPREDQPQRGEWTPYGDATAVYDYTDETGKLLFQVCRTPDKKFPQRVPDLSAKSGYRWKVAGVRRVLYRLPKILQAVQDGEIIYLAEGEKDVHALEAAGVVATTPPGGASQPWQPGYSEFLRDAIVRVIADADKPGRAHARKVAASLEGIASAVEIIEAATGKDAADHLAAGHSVADFVVTKDASVIAQPDLAQDLYEFLSETDAAEDWVIPGLLERGDRLIWTGLEGLGKALALDTPIPTPKGWTTMGALSVGDEVFGAVGEPVRVTVTTPVMTGRTCYRVTFSDGAQIVADADHQWLTETLRARECAAASARRPGGLKKRGTDQRHKRAHFPAVVTTEQIRGTLWAREGHALNHSVEVCGPLRYAAQELPIGPYTLGAWLGDGSSYDSRLTCGDADTELLNYIRAEGYEVEHKGRLQYRISNRSERDRHIAEGRRLAAAGMPTLTAAAHAGIGKDTLLGASGRPPGHRASMHTADGPALGRYRSMQELLRQLGVMQNKHIPRLYMEASAPQRLALLQGLMDTDGTVSGKGSVSGRGAGTATCEFSVVSERLARDVHELLIGLGIKVQFRTGRAVLDGRFIGARYRLAFQTDLPVFRLRRKAERLAPLRTRRGRLRYIEAVEPVDSVPVRCIQVDSPDHLYLAGRECIPTHNTVVTRQLAMGAAAGLHPFTDILFPPRKVLFIDCENPVRKSRRRFRELEVVTRGKRRPVPEGGFRIIHRPEAIDLSREEEAAWLIERVTAHKPDLLVIGPLYKLHALDINEELAARAIVSVLDKARAQADCAVIIEGHAPHGDNTTRALRPVGSSLFMRWPEFGYGIRRAPDSQLHGKSTRRRVAVQAWRGPRDERDWPRLLGWGPREGIDWPWVPLDEEKPELRAVPSAG